MAEYVSVAQAREMPGMRLIVAPGLPGPWAEPLKAMLDVKKIPYTLAAFEVGSDHADLIAWTAQASSPVLAWNDEFPKSTWAEQLTLVESLEPTPALIPRRADERIQMFGYAHEICGRGGFGWSRRLMFLHLALANPDLPPEHRALFESMGAKYGYSPAAAEAAPARVIEILNALSKQLEAQHAKGSRYLVGDGLTALDLYWAGMSHLIEPPPPDVCPMIDEFRPAYQNVDPQVDAAARPLLMEHRDFVYREHLPLPMDL